MMTLDRSTRRPAARWLAIGLLALGWGVLPHPVAAAGPEPDLVRARLIGERTGVAPGGSVDVALDLVIKPGWHVYWRNPGDAGIPTDVAWRLPEGWTAGPLEWPAPANFTVGEVADYGYAGAVTLPARLTAPSTARPGQQAIIQAEASWLVCSDICVPGSATLRLSLAVTEPGRTASLSGTAEPFRKARATIPVIAPFDTRFRESAGDFALEGPLTAVAGLKNPSVSFAPYAPGVIIHRAPQRLTLGDDRFLLTLKREPNANATPPTALDGVLLISGEAGGEPVTRRFEIHPTLGKIPPTVTPPAAAAESVVATPAPGLFEALGLAFLGGLILNLMPCVFPILSLKLLALARQAGGDRRSARIGGLAYGAGVLVSFALVGGALMIARAGGEAVGWGFQLQSPTLVAALAGLLFAMGLSLSGVVEFGASITGLGARQAERGGAAGAFATGALATIVATPCTAPFMGAAVGYAVTAPIALGLGVFLALGAGLALPLTLASFAPGIGRLLPRPGRWMETLKQALAFPVHATVAWLVWVASEETRGAALPSLLACLVLIGLAAWALGRGGRWIGRILATGCVVAVIGLIAAVGPARSADPAVAGRPPEGSYQEPFSTARLDALRRSGKPVFVNLTAAWCITCLVNERTTLDTPDVRARFETGGIAYLKGDWTNQNPEIAAFLNGFGRAGVPLYVYFPRDNGAAIILPQILSIGEILGVLR